MIPVILKWKFSSFSTWLCFQEILDFPTSVCKLVKFQQFLRFYWYSLAWLGSLKIHVRLGHVHELRTVHVHELRTVRTCENTAVELVYAKTTPGGTNMFKSDHKIYDWGHLTHSSSVFSPIFHSCVARKAVMILFDTFGSYKLSSVVIFAAYVWCRSRITVSNI